MVTRDSSLNLTSTTDAFYKMLGEVRIEVLRNNTRTKELKEDLYADFRAAEALISLHQS